MVYSSIESVILVIPTFVSVFLLLELKVPESAWKSKSELIPAIASLILLAEIVWVWHAILYFTFELPYIQCNRLVFVYTSLEINFSIRFIVFDYSNHWIEYAFFSAPS
jgi:hypothetical protein